MYGYVQIWFMVNPFKFGSGLHLLVVAACLFIRKIHGALEWICHARCSSRKWGGNGMRGKQPICVVFAPPFGGHQMSRYSQTEGSMFWRKGKRCAQREEGTLQLRAHALHRFVHAPFRPKCGPCCRNECTKARMGVILEMLYNAATFVAGHSLCGSLTF